MMAMPENILYGCNKNLHLHRHYFNIKATVIIYLTGRKVRNHWLLISIPRVGPFWHT